MVSVPICKLALKDLEKPFKKCKNGKPGDPPPNFCTNMAMLGIDLWQLVLAWLTFPIACCMVRPWSKGVASWSATSSSLACFMMALVLFMASSMKDGRCGMASSTWPR